MNKSRRIGALVAATVASVGMASLVAPTAAEAAPRGPEPVSNFVQRVRANTDSWVGIRWQTNRRICDAQVWVSGRRVDVDYPRHARSTTFSRGDSLRPGRTDYTAFRVNADYSRSGVALLRATIVYDNCGRFDRPMRRTFGLAMPVIAHRPGHGGPIGHGHGHGHGHGNGNGNNGGGHDHGNNGGGHDHGNNGGGHDTGGNNNGGGHNTGGGAPAGGGTGTGTGSPTGGGSPNGGGSHHGGGNNTGGGQGGQH